VRTKSARCQIPRQMPRQSSAPTEGGQRDAASVIVAPTTRRKRVASAGASRPPALAPTPQRVVNQHGECSEAIAQSVNAFPRHTRRASPHPPGFPEGSIYTRLSGLTRFSVASGPSPSTGKDPGSARSDFSGQLRCQRDARRPGNRLEQVAVAETQNSVQETTTTTQDSDLSHSRARLMPSEVEWRSL
jgi:hypothetical protein